MSQKKRNGGFSVPCELKVWYIFTSLDKASSPEENDAKLIKFGWVILILCPFLEIQSFSNFAWLLRPTSEELWREKPSIQCFVEAQLIHSFNKRKTEQWASTGQRMECLSQHGILRLSVQKSSEFFENDCISRSVHRFKITQPNLTILVSFSSAEDVLSNDVKKYEIFGLQGTENPPFRFFWDTWYMKPQCSQNGVTSLRCGYLMEVTGSACMWQLQDSTWLLWDLHDTFP